MSIQDKLNSCLESMNIYPINIEEDTINLEADAKDYVVKNSKEYLVEDDFELDYKVNLDKNNILKTKKKVSSLLFHQ